ncbi:hypothetical protein BC937DRAFT_88643 [Endogone sp. FLAS-F59071]|nr:hypothetical protein BC937DRAFT_88643 [Endogone sp. FLAS-F59071]|eukprot:RUS18540.1 hypothetical protein BC937DRAFT_88643 [Endogone sp. FLAS-F59071]
MLTIANADGIEVSVNIDGVMSVVGLFSDEELPGMVIMNNIPKIFKVDFKLPKGLMLNLLLT